MDTMKKTDYMDEAFLDAAAAEAIGLHTVGDSEFDCPSNAKLLDSAGLPLAEMHAAASEGALGEQGPVCVRKGDAISASATGAGARVRWIAWALP